MRFLNLQAFNYCDIMIESWKRKNLRHRSIYHAMTVINCYYAPMKGVIANRSRQKTAAGCLRETRAPGRYYPALNLAPCLKLFNLFAQPPLLEFVNPSRSLPLEYRRVAAAACFAAWWYIIQRGASNRLFSNKHFCNACSWKEKITNLTFPRYSLDNLNINEIFEFLKCILLDTAIVILLMNLHLWLLFACIIRF